MRIKTQSGQRRKKIDPGLLARLKELPTADVASALGISLKRNKAMCFNGHDSKSPSFTVSKNGRNWKCFGCGEFGDSISLVQRFLGVEFNEACEWLCASFSLSSHIASSIPTRPSRVNLIRKTGALPLPKPGTPSTTQADPELYEWLVGRCGKIQDPRGVQYLLDHGISQNIAKAFGVVELKDTSYAYQELAKKWGKERLHRAGLTGTRNNLVWSGYGIVFPFYENQRIEYIQIRCFEGRAKFMGPIGVAKPIYNKGRLALLGSNQTLHICEGVPDALALESVNLPAIAIQGASSFRTEWVESLLAFRLVGVPDGDSGGQTFQKCLRDAFRQRGKAISFVVLPDGQDASDVISRIGNDKLS